MKLLTINPKKIPFLALAIVFTVSCEKSAIAPDLSNYNVQFQVEAINFEKEYTSVVVSTALKHREWQWYLGDDQVYLEISNTFMTYLENGDSIRMDFGITNYEENVELLGLEDTSSTKYMRGATWFYKDPENMKRRFFNNPEIDYISFNYGNALFFGADTTSDFFNETTVLNINNVYSYQTGTYVDISFSGRTFGWYDPTGEYGYYEIKNGRLQGFIN